MKPLGAGVIKHSFYLLHHAKEGETLEHKEKVGGVGDWAGPGRIVDQDDEALPAGTTAAIC